LLAAESCAVECLFVARRAFPAGDFAGILVVVVGVFAVFAGAFAGAFSGAFAGAFAGGLAGAFAGAFAGIAGIFAEVLQGFLPTLQGA